ncbi:MAG TPA: hypothetical protein VNU01_12330 [Egibacteraceae bacterium]|nr:hypothetical protein [Egibacteraceae bacterium]
MSVWDLPGQATAADVLRRAVAAGEVSHAWAFVGPAGVGQQQAGRALAAALNCPVDPAGCGHCDVCGRVLRGAFPALWEFAPAGQAHRVADVRERWLPVASQTAVEGRWKVLHIADADRMNEAAANAFLKGLEEPPERTIWLLDVADPDELPDTILSRCRVVRFAPWSLEELRAHAARLGIPPEDHELAARLSQGAPRAMERLAGGGLEDVRRHRDLLRRLREEGQGVALLAARELDEELKRRTAAQKAAGKDELADLAAAYGDALPRPVAKQVEERLVREEREARASALQGALDDLLSWVRDALLLAGGGDPSAVLHCDAAGALRDDAAALGPAGLLRAADLVQAAKQDLELNLQQGLALEALLLDLAALGMDVSRGAAAVAAHPGG